MPPLQEEEEEEEMIGTSLPSLSTSVLPPSVLFKQHLAGPGSVSRNKDCLKEETLFWFCSEGECVSSVIVFNMYFDPHRREGGVCSGVREDV